MKNEKRDQICRSDNLKALRMYACGSGAHELPFGPVKTVHERQPLNIFTCVRNGKPWNRDRLRENKIRVGWGRSGGQSYNFLLFFLRARKALKNFLRRPKIFLKVKFMKKPNFYWDLGSFENIIEWKKTHFVLIIIIILDTSAIDKNKKSLSKFIFKN